MMFQLDTNLCFHSAFPNLSVLEVKLGIQICLTLDTPKMYASTTYAEFHMKAVQTRSTQVSLGTV